MNFLDKVNNAAKNAAKKAGTYAQKAQGFINDSISNKTGSKSGNLYIPHPIDLANSVPMGSENEEREPWKAVQARPRSFAFNGRVINIPENMDAFNTYRTVFLSLARNCADKAKQEYTETVHDYITFVELFPQIYDSNLYPLLQKAIDVLLSESMWTVSFESFAAAHKSSYHLIADDYNYVIERTHSYIAANKKVVSGTMSTVTDYASKKIGDKPVKGLFNVVKDQAVDQAVNSTGINTAQQDALYKLINSKSENIFSRIYSDYANVLNTLILTLNKNGKNIWILTKQASESARNIFKNLTNPSFPQDKVSEVLIELIKTDPYNPDYYSFMASRYGETEEIDAIRSYFGF